MGADGGCADTKLTGNLLVGEPQGYTTQDFHFAVGQMSWLGFWFGILGMQHHQRGQLLGQGNPVLKNIVNRAHQLIRRGVLSSGSPARLR